MYENLGLSFTVVLLLIREFSAGEIVFEATYVDIHTYTYIHLYIHMMASQTLWYKKPKFEA